MRDQHDDMRDKRHAGTQQTVSQVLSEKQDKKKRERYDTLTDENPLICRGTD